MKWDTLTSAQHDRLCDCRSLKADILPIARAYKIERGYDAEQALITALEHLDMNGQFFDLTSEEFEKLQKSL